VGVLRKNNLLFFRYMILPLPSLEAGTGTED
jgi:hypothetical protein